MCTPGVFRLCCSVGSSSREERISVGSVASTELVVASHRGQLDSCIVENNPIQSKPTGARSSNSSGDGRSRRASDSLNSTSVGSFLESTVTMSVPTIVKICGSYKEDAADWLYRY